MLRVSLYIYFPIFQAQNRPVVVVCLWAAHAFLHMWVLGHMEGRVLKSMICHVDPNLTSLSFKEIGCLT